MATPSQDVCVVCKSPLVLEVERELEDESAMEASSAAEPQFVEDDVLLQCGCHFHWSVYPGHSGEPRVSYVFESGSVY